MPDHVAGHGVEGVKIVVAESRPGLRSDINFSAGNRWRAGPAADAAFGGGQCGRLPERITGLGVERIGPHVCVPVHTAGHVDISIGKCRCRRASFNRLLPDYGAVFRGDSDQVTGSVEVEGRHVQDSVEKGGGTGQGPVDGVGMPDFLTAYGINAEDVSRVGSAVSPACEVEATVGVNRNRLCHFISRAAGRHGKFP